ncbi:MAG: CPBP family intramembrane metalloprotease [Eubacteriales bacterium]|nr:CPBP family intramembrane metalloprotease [Eubacteriales bacterium]
MKIQLKQKQMWLPGMALLLSFLLLIGCGIVFDYLFSRFPAVGVIIDELLAFGLPALLLYLLREERFPVYPRLKRRKGYYLQYFGFTVKFALMISLLSFLANLLIYVMTGSSQISLNSVISASSVGSKYSLLTFVAIVIIPPIVEEIFLRGMLFSVMENVAGTGLCIFMSGLCFAFLHADLFNFVGPFIAGCAYAFLSYSFDSLWPAIIAHFINNLYYYIINHLVTLYSSFGIWQYFTFINVILFLVMLYFTLRSLEIQIQHNKLLKFRPGRARLRDCISDLIGNPGFFIFVVAFFFTIIFT